MCKTDIVVMVMAILRESDKQFIRELFEKELKDDVRIVVFTSNDNCEYCQPTVEILKELASLSPKIKLEEHDYNSEKQLAESMGVDKVPATVIAASNGAKLYYFGIPSGYEFRSLLDDIVDVSKNTTRLPEEVRAQIRGIGDPVHIKVFVTPTCPYCPRAVRTAHQFALENPNIRADMIEALEFPELAQQYNVMAVPKVVINESTEFEGALPENVFAESVVSALS
jgi:glutaredoxin-like protein